MCHDYRLNVEASAIPDDFANLKIKVWFSEGAPRAVSERTESVGGFPNQLISD